MADIGFTESSIEKLPLPARVKNCLNDLGITTVGEAIAARDSDLLRAPNFGRTSLDSLRRALNEFVSSEPVGEKPNTMTDFMTVKEAAAHLRLSVHTLNAYRYKGNGPPYFKLGGSHVRYDRQQLESWARSEPCNSTSEYRS